jgi:hypothetical protein
MNGVSRFLSRREKHHAEKRKSKDAARNKSRLHRQVPSDLYKIFTNEDSETTAGKESQKNVRQ